MADPRILTCSVTGGSTTRAQNPNLPVTPEEIANSCLEAAEAGAAMCHIHVRDPETGEPSTELEYYRDVVERIRAANSGTRSRAFRPAFPKPGCSEWRTGSRPLGAGCWTCRTTASRPFCRRVVDPEPWLSVE